MSLAWWLNTAWMLKCTGEARAFRRACRRVADTQTRLLRDTLQANRDTAFGRAHGFAHIDTPRAYQERVPLATAEEHATAVARVAAGEPGVLTAAPVELLEPTSGTTGGEKLIPYTASLRRQFQRAVAAWVADLFRHRPAVRGGRAYWSISPALGGTRRTSAGIPIGFDEDAAYLGALERIALGRLLVVPPGVARLPDLEAFRYATLLHLLRAEDLALVSVWSPTFLTALLAPLEAWQDRLLFDLRRGTLSPPTSSTDLPRALVSPKGDPKRAYRLHGILRSRLPLAEKLRQVWPRLALISCWADAGAARYLPELRALFPWAEVQPKGLLATEGCVTFPLVGRPAPVLAVRSHFFEFEEADTPGRCRLAHELERDGRYRVVLTTAGGLYRYPLGDEVEVAGFEGECPLLRFVGRAGGGSDLVGEKLSEPHVRAVLDRLCARYGLALRFALVVPVEDAPPHYRLYLQGASDEEDSRPLGGLAAALEAGLRENPYYAYAVQLGQLAPAGIAWLPHEGESVWRVYERECLRRGQRAGNLKPVALDPRPGWAAVLQPANQPAVVS